MATGLLTIFVGRATRAVEFAEAQEKTYIARLRLGVTTDTQDSTGRVLQACETRVSQAELEAVLPQFLGEILQVPPMYSAIKVDGQRLYKLARQGVEVERKARPVTIHRLAVLGEADGEFDLEIVCSKGTYIRTLCHDIGQALGCGGVMAALRRTQVGAFSVADAYGIAEVEAAADRAGFLRPLDTLFAVYPALTVDAMQERRIRNGGNVILKRGSMLGTSSSDVVRVYGQDGTFLALGAVEWKLIALSGNTHVLDMTPIKSFFEPKE